MFKPSQVDWNLIPQFVSYMTDLNEKLMQVYNDTEINDNMKNARVADLVNGIPS